MTPYNQFKADFLKLCDHVLAKPDVMIDLGNYTLLGCTSVKEANRTHICNTPACLAGSVPEVFPDRFMWNTSGVPTEIRDPDSTTHCHRAWGFACIYVLADNLGTPDHHGLSLLFRSKGSESMSDREEVEARRAVVDQCTGYDELCQALEDVMWGHDL
jgi:hypothetical protein